VISDPDLLAAIARTRWIFAKTMARTPHWYVRRGACDDADFCRLFDAIQKSGSVERFGAREYRYLYAGDGFKYWTMTDDLRKSVVINRAEVKAPPGSRTRPCSGRGR
jgi:hypothetical protein